MSVLQLPEELIALDGRGEWFIVGEPRAFAKVPGGILVRDGAHALRFLEQGMQHPDISARLVALYARQSDSGMAWWRSTPDVAAGLARMIEAGTLYALLLPDPMMEGEQSPVEPVGAAAMQAQGPVEQWSLAARFRYVLEHTPAHLDGKVKEAFANLLTESTLIAIVAALVIWAGSHAMAGAGFAVDGILIAIGLVIVGWSIFDAIGHLAEFLRLTVNARTQADLDAAAMAVAMVVVVLGVEMFERLLTRGASRLVPKQAGGSQARREQDGNGAGGGARASTPSEARTSESGQPQGQGGQAANTQERPSWRQSERDAGDRLGEGYSDQRSYKDGQEVPYGTKGSTRPDWSRPGESIEVKNYDLQSRAGQDRLVRNVTEQARHRAQHMPEGTVQKVVIDARGQNVSRATLENVAERLSQGSDGIISVDNISIVR